MSNALVTGGSIGLGRALALELARVGWSLTIDARHAPALLATQRELEADAPIQALVGDITDARHRSALVAAAATAGPVDLVINNASSLGASPLPALRDLEAETYDQLWRTNVLAPHQLVRALLPRLSPVAVIINISSDAGVEHYPTWGGYGSSKAALDHQTLTWAAEEPRWRWYAVDPGDLRTALHADAFPGEDISDRPEPATVAPAIIALVSSGRPSGRYRAADLVETSVPEGLG